jgi:proline dehydrogenase
MRPLRDGTLIPPPRFPGPVGLLVRFAGQWVAGERLEDAIRATGEANARGLDGILNLLGEHHKEKAQVEATLKEYLHILDSIEKGRLRASVSIKPSQFGLELGRAYCESMVLPLFDRLRAMGNFLWMDMEGSRTIPLRSTRRSTAATRTWASVSRQTSSGRRRTWSVSSGSAGRSGSRRGRTANPTRSRT